MKLLLVEDEHQIGRLWVEHLSAEGATVKWVTTAKAGVSAIDDHPYDVAILDARLPDGHGLDILRAMRDRGIQTPVLVTSQYLDSRMGFEAGRLGAVQILEKPITPAELLQSVRVAANAPSLSTSHRSIQRSEFLRALGDPVLSLLQFDELVRQAATLADAYTDKNLAVASARGSLRRKPVPSIIEVCLASILCDRLPSRQGIASRIGVSPRALGAMLMESTGSGFRYWCRVARFQRLLRSLLEPGHRLRISEAAYGAGYEHARVAVRDSRFFLRLTPREVVRAANLDELH